MSAALFYKPTCGYCRRVTRYMEQNGIEMALKNINENINIRQELIAISGKSQVPCLVVDDTPIFESDEIIEWLAENWSEYDHKGN